MIYLKIPSIFNYTTYTNINSYNKMLIEQSSATMKPTSPCRQEHFTCDNIFYIYNMLTKQSSVTMKPPFPCKKALVFGHDDNINNVRKP